MPSVDLTDQEWQQVMAMLSSAPWRDANPLLMKIGQQLQAQQVNKLPDRLNKQPQPFDGKETPHGQQ